MTESGLNLFQRLARRWEVVHPYNAAQVMRIAGPMDCGLAQETWGQALRDLGLGRVRVSESGGFHHEALNGELAHYPLAVLHADTRLDGHLTSELNRPFDDPREPPFRPFLLQDNDSFHFGVVYQHWVADSVSIQCVMRQWFTRVFDPRAARCAPLRIAQSGYAQLFASRSGWRVDETILSGVRAHMRHRRVRKVRGVGPPDYPVRVSIHSAPEGLIDRLRCSARTAGLKVHDVLLAAMTEACDRFVPTQARPNRQDVSVGSIVDVRRHAGIDLSDVFGLFLGFTHVVCRRNDLNDWPRLLRCVASQNRIHKENGLAQTSMLWMMAALAVNRFVPDRNLYHFYRKELPMLGGLSNVNLNDTWAARYHPNTLLDYLRVSPTGPLVPLVFSTTTLGSRLTIALTSRASLFTDDSESAMAESFLHRLSRSLAVDNVAAK